MIARALGHSGLAILMTTLTTAGGLVSFAAASLQPLADFGVFGPLGVFCALLFTLTLLPALLALVPLRAPQNDRRVLGTDAIDRFLGWCSRTAVARSGLVLALAAGLIAFSLFGIARLRFSQDTMEWLPESHPTRTATEFMDRKLRGSLPLEVLLETDRENAFHDPALLHALDKLHAYADSMRLGEIRVGKTLSLIDPLKETNRALHENRPEFHSIPDDRGLVAQEMLLFENAGSDDLNDFVDSQFSRAALTLRVSWCDAMNGTLFIDELERNFRRILPADVHIHMTGEMTLFNRIFRAVIASMARSYTIAFLVVTPLMMLLLWSVRTGLLSMLPNVLPVLTILGLMGWADLPLDFSTMMVGAILLGVAVDDTIHFMHAFRGERRRCGETASAIHAALHSTGRAMLSTSIVLVGGFVVFTLATMTNIVVVGILTSVAVVVAFLADVLLAPALLVRAPFASGCLKREGLRRLTCLRREAEEW